MQYTALSSEQYSSRAGTPMNRFEAQNDLKEDNAKCQLYTEKPGIEQ